MGTVPRYLARRAPGSSAMTSFRPPAFRRALGPLGAMAVLGLTAGFLIGQDAARAGSSKDTAPGVVPVHTPSGGATSSTSSGGKPHALARMKRMKQTKRTSGAAESVRAEYRFLLTESADGGPIRWDPCRPLHYKVSLGKTVPESEIPYVRMAFDAAGKALGGMVFVYEGTTDVVPDAVDDSARADADIVFAFTEAGPGAASSDLLNGWEAGRGGFAAANAPTTERAGSAVRQRPTHGSVVLDVTKWAVMTRHDRSVLYLHEIGHAVGLDHPENGRQIMSSGAYDLPAEYQPGDLAGFARLGRQAGCG